MVWSSAARPSASASLAARTRRNSASRAARRSPHLAAGGVLTGGIDSRSARSRRVGLQRGVDDAVDRRRDAGGGAEADDGAAQPVELEPVAALEVVMHRGGDLRRQAIDQ